MNKILKVAVLVGVVSFALAPLTFAQIVIPTSTTADLSTAAAGQISDPGTLQVLVLVAGTIFAFWLIHQLLGLIPRSRGGKRT